MLLQAVFFAHSGLNAALGHHGVAVADAQLVGHNHACAGLSRGERCCGTGTAAADHQHIGIHRHRAGQIEIINQGAAQQQFGQIGVAEFAGIGTHGQGGAGALAVIRMVLAQERFFFGQIGAHGQRRAAQRLQGLGVIHAFIGGAHQRASFVAASISTRMLPLSICCRRRIKSIGRSVRAAFIRRANKPKWLGRMFSGQASVHRLHITH